MSVTGCPSIAACTGARVGRRGCEVDTEDKLVYGGSALSISGGLMAISADYFRSMIPVYLGLAMCLVALGLVLYTFYLNDR